MPANVESMFSVRQMPWHREGTVLADYPGDWDTARQLAGLDWDPVSTDIYAVSGINPDGTERTFPEGFLFKLRGDQSAFVLHKGQPITARSIRFTITTSEGSKQYTMAYKKGMSLEVHIYEADLPGSR